MAEQRVQRRLAAILAADVVGYSRMMREDETGTLAQLKTLRKEVFDPRIAEHNGRIVKTTGDGVLVEFASAVDATECAIKVQRGLARRNEDVPEGHRIELRIGINLGDIIVDGEDIHGDGVNVAARLEGLCDTGEVYVSAVVHDQVEGKIEAEFEDLGDHSVKNIDDPVRVYRVSRKMDASREPSADIDPGQPLPLPDKPSIAVLPFENMSSDPEQDYLSDGLSEDIITTLSKIPDLFVVARNSTFVYKGRLVDIKQVGREQGVRYVLEGSIRKAGDRVRITAQLIDAETGNHLWADRYDRELADLFALQDDVTWEVVSALQVTLREGDQARVWRRSTSDMDAWMRCTQGWAFMRRHTKADEASATSLFDQAIKNDPKFALPWVGLAWTQLDEARFGWSDDAAVSLTNAFKNAEKAVELDPDLADAHAVLCAAHRINGDWNRSIAAGEQAIGLSPNSAEVHAILAQSMMYAGRPEDGFHMIQSAMRLSPIPLGVDYVPLGLGLILTGRMEEAYVAFQKSREEHESLMGALMSTWSSIELGRLEQARETAEEVLKVDPGFRLGRVAKFLTFKDPSVTDRILSSLAKAGLPE